MHINNFSRIGLVHLLFVLVVLHSTPGDPASRPTSQRPPPTAALHADAPLPAITLSPPAATGGLIPHGANCDDPAIQQAVYQACGAVPPAQPGPYPISTVILANNSTTTPYLLCAPIEINCNLTLQGAGSQYTHFTSNYIGPDFLVQAFNPAAPSFLTSGPHPSWAVSTSVSIYSEILDANGHLQVAATSGLTGTSPPAWAITPGTSTMDGTVRWMLTLPGPSLVPGPGAAFDGLMPGSWIDLDSLPTLNVNGLAALTIEFFVDDVGFNTQSAQLIVSSQRAAPDQVSGGAFLVSQTCWNGPSSCRLSAGINTSVTGLVSVSAPLILNVLHHVAAVYDGTALRLYIDGVQTGSTPASGTIEQHVFENVAVGQYRAVWPAANPYVDAIQGYVDSLRISDTVRYSASFTPPATKLTNDSQTLLLLNFESGSTPGTYLAHDGTDVHGRSNIYIPYETSDSEHEIAGASIAGMDLCQDDGDGIYSTWTVYSTFRDLACTYMDQYTMDLQDNDYEDYISQVYSGASYPGVQGKVRTSGAFIFGNQSGANEYDHVRCDDATACIIENGGSGLYESPIATDRGDYVYPFIVNGGAATFLAPYTDFEAPDDNFRGSIYSEGTWGAGVSIIGGFLMDPKPKHSHFVVQKGGAPVFVQSTDFSGGPNFVVRIMEPPTSPVELSGDNLNNITPVIPDNARYVDVTH